MTVEQNIARRDFLVLAGSALAFSLLGILGSMYYPHLRQWLLRASVHAIILHADRACNPMGKVCTVSDAASTITLRLGDNIKPLTPFPVLVSLAGMAATRVNKVTVYFTMVNMDMGINGFDLSQRVDGTWQGQALLPVCSMGRRDWQVTIEVASDTPYVGEFNLLTSP